MNFTTTFFIVLSLITIIYIFYVFKKETRIPIIVEFFFLIIYSSILIIFLFPGIINTIENITKIKSLINFVLYLSIFIAYFSIFILYKKTEIQRQEITKLVREIALIENKKNDKK